MILGAIGEWIVGNTFPFVVFGTFGKLSSRTPQTPPRRRAASLNYPFLALQAPSGSPSAALSSHLSTHTEPTSPIPHKWPARMETLETRSACRHQGSTLALRSSLSSWVRLDILPLSPPTQISFLHGEMNGRKKRLMPKCRHTQD